MGFEKNILPSQCCQVLGDDQAYMSARKWQSKERAKEPASMIEDVLPRLIFTTRHQTIITHGLKAAHLLSAEDL